MLHKALTCSVSNLQKFMCVIISIILEVLVSSVIQEIQYTGNFTQNFQ